MVAPIKNECPTAFLLFYVGEYLFFRKTKRAKHFGWYLMYFVHIVLHFFRAVPIQSYHA